MEALIASMSALGVEENRPPHMVFEDGFGVSSATVFHLIGGDRLAFATFAGRGPTPE
jgi:hypothetical protein